MQSIAAVKLNTRPSVKGKFLSLGDEKLYVRGVTYGTFRPAHGSDYPDPSVVERDFALMAAAGANAVRVYTVPPRWLLDLAERHGLRVMVGLPWEQHMAFLASKERVHSIEERVRAGVRACAGHPAVLCYAIGNEIPAPIVRWHGPRRIERFLERLHSAAKAEDPDGLVTYVNFPTTEYLELPFLDFACFNVYLEAQRTLEAYLARLHNLVGDKPLLMAEIGLDSRRNGEDTQAEVLRWQVETAFASGCAGAFVFAWTDEWNRGGHDIEDWDFGLTDRDRNPKPALGSVEGAFAAAPFPGDVDWPRISVVVCTHNGERTLRDCLEGCERLAYPDFEVIVVDDGSTDATASIASDYGCRLIRTDNHGLASARNTGLHAAEGEIVAYLDDDARPDPHWLTYLAAAFGEGAYVGVGGPNVPPGGDGTVADCVAAAPGGPIHVLLSDREAEHIPGCNMAFRKDHLEAIDGFDPRFRAAGDDVDVCWRLQQHGWTLGFSPAAMVWHHPRDSVRAYWRQQKGYGRAEAVLEQKWPERYNAAGHLSWRGRLYGGAAFPGLWRRRRVRYGTWGSRLFQSVYEPAQGMLAALPLMPEWYLLIAALAAIAALGALWPPLLLTLPLLVLSVATVLVQTGLAARRASYPSPSGSFWRGPLTQLLHVLQPLARLRGRLAHGLTPWRRRGSSRPAVPRPRERRFWSEGWNPPEERIALLEAALLDAGAPVRRGGEGDRWDLQVRGGILGTVRMLSTVEEHGAGRQLLRVRHWPRWSPAAFVLAGLFGVLALAAGLDGAGAAATALGVVAGAVVGRGVYESAAATASLQQALAQPERSLGSGARALGRGE